MEDRREGRSDEGEPYEHAALGARATLYLAGARRQWFCHLSVHFIALGWKKAIIVMLLNIRLGCVEGMEPHPQVSRTPDRQQQKRGELWQARAHVKLYHLPVLRPSIDKVDESALRLQGCF